MRLRAGFFAVTMLASVGALVSATPAGAATVTVQATSPSTDSGVFIASGHSVTVSAVGSWNVDPGEGDTGPEGLGFGCSPDCAATGLSYQSLLGSTNGAASWFEIGLGPVTVNGPGELLLAANDGHCCYDDNHGSVDVTITSNDPAPVLAFTPPANITVDPTSSAGRVVTFATPIASDGVHESVPPVTCASSGGLTSGSVFPIGTTTVNCSVTDPDDDPSTVAHSFTITVNHKHLSITPGVNPPAAKAQGPTTGASVTFAKPYASDEDGAVPVTCNPRSGTWFDPGDTTVTCNAFAADDTPSSVSTTLTVTVTPMPPGPNPPVMGTATPGDGLASVSYGPPAFNGGPYISNYTVTCVSSDGGIKGSASGMNTPLSVSPLSNGHTYTCQATATNSQGTSPPSNASNAFVPGTQSDTCTNTDTCHLASATQSSSANPSEKVDVKGIPTDPTGTINLVVGLQPLNCAGSPVSSPSASMTNTGFSPSSKLTVTLTQFAVAIGPGKVCYSSDIPFLSVTNPKTPKAGTAILLQCSAVASKAPCQVSSTQSLSAIVVKILAPGGDPTFSVVVPTGRLVWPSTFPNGKVGTAYSAHLLSKGGKAPFHWKISSGSLPPGLSINPGSGTVTGKPTSKGTFKSVVHVTDSEAHPQSANISVSITIN